MPPNCTSGDVPEAPPSLDMPSPIPLRPPAVQESPPAPPGKVPVDIKEETTHKSPPPLAIKAPEEVKSSPSSHSPPAAAAATPETVDSSSGGSSDDDAREYANIERTRKNDVLCGRGVTTNRHPGNEKFRALVHANKVRIMPYCTCGLVDSIVAHFPSPRRSSQPPLCASLHLILC